MILNEVPVKFGTSFLYVVKITPLCILLNPKEIYKSDFVRKKIENHNIAFMDKKR